MASYFLLLKFLFLLYSRPAERVQPKAIGIGHCFCPANSNENKDREMKSPAA